VRTHGRACAGPTPTAFASRAAGRNPPALGLDAEVSCEALAGPGKVRCAVRVHPRGGDLHWSDVIVVGAPSFAPPLRTRAGLSDLVRRDESGVEYLIALAGTADGSGKLRVRARAIVCAVGCQPVSAEAETNVAVGGSAP